MTLEELKALLPDWQRRLRLQDWDIDLEIARYHQIGERGLTRGECLHFTKKKHAFIRFLDPADQRTDTKPDHDDEYTLVHELLHLIFQPFEANDWDSVKGVAQEVAIHRLTEALIQLKREAENEKTERQSRSSGA